MSNLDRTNHDKPYNGSRKRANCFVSRHTLACHASCVSLLMWEDSYVTVCCFHFCTSLFFLKQCYSSAFGFIIRADPEMRFVSVPASVYICALLYLHSINASSPPNSSSRRTRHTTAAVVPLPSVLQGAVIQEKRHPMRRRKKKHKLSDMAALEGQKGLLQYVCTVTKLTGTARAYRRSPKIP